MATTNRPNIVLTGPLGAGKTAVGRRIATLTGREFVDMHAEIVGLHGDLSGEDATARRNMVEREMVEKLTPRRDLVIATTSTTMLNPDNVVSFLGSEVYNLTADTSTLLERITDEGIALRPQLAEADDASKTLRGLVDEGARTLAKFPTVDTTDMELSEVIDALRDAGADIVDPTAVAATGSGLEGTADMDATTRVFVYVIAAALAVLVVLLFLVLTF